MVTDHGELSARQRADDTDHTHPDLAGELAELLEALWEHGREVPSAPASPSQLRVLHCLDRDEGINLRTLGELLGSAPPSVSRLCDRLEALGFVRRVPSKVSRRELELHLTRHGRTYLRTLRDRRVASLREVTDRMTPAARRVLLDGLVALRDALEQTQGASGRGADGDVRSA
ncbi:MarR family transcriptional regulator [Streptomyces longispororuber]|uniref:MarR family transcriptional regulator n=1 Tax=Streptomyces longispororuber TaxID=68230 RepID=A0A919DFB4_9ACTN|nr:MarR family transcriptional regulator [Streptomyces longispororuber]GHE41028.1 MarR family transcriptional regulator [Streptomyces longispororuber]